MISVLPAGMFFKFMQAIIAAASDAVPDWNSRYPNGENRSLSIPFLLGAIGVPAGR